MILLLSISGCKSQETELQRGMDLRDKLMLASFSFSADITADFGQYFYDFSLSCTAYPAGHMLFEVTGPESIAGISGKLTADNGYLQFDDTALSFPLLAEGELSPVSAPWILVNTLRAGYLVSVGDEGEQYRLTYHDTYAAESLQVDVWVNRNNIPVRAEFFWKGTLVLSLVINDFTFL